MQQTRVRVRSFDVHHVVAKSDYADGMPHICAIRVDPLASLRFF